MKLRDRRETFFKNDYDRQRFLVTVGDGPRQRHHVRFWRWDREENGRPM